MRAPISRRSIGLLLLVAASIATPAKAGILWYNGDFDGRGSLLDENNVPATNTTSPAPPIQKSLVYDNFIVPVGQTWTISSVFSNDFVAYAAAPTTASWAIRSGVSAGNGGTLIASGDTAATLTPLSYIQNGFVAETVTASVPSIVLTAGTYWLGVAPDSAGYYSDQSFIMTTSGINAIGTPLGNDGNSFITNTYPPVGSAGSFNYTPTTTAVTKRGVNPYGPTIDFSMGVNGTFAVPEPSSVALVAVGLLGSLACTRKRRSARAL